MKNNSFESKNEFNYNRQHIHQSKQRENYSQNNPPKQFSYQKNTNQPSQNQKMQKFITQTVKKVVIGGNKYLAFSTLKPNQKSLLSTVAALLSSFDDHFQEQNLTIDMIIDIFKTLGYPHSINKTVFQPVGAPHTWGVCLQMMNWLAELANFHYDLRIHISQMAMQDDINTILLNSYLQNQPNSAKIYLENQIQRKIKNVQDCQYKIKTNNLAIDNIKLSQPQLTQMESEQKRLLSILDRQNQEIIQIEKQNQSNRKKIQEWNEKIFQAQRKSQMNQREIQSLRLQIQHQELSVEQVQKIKFQTRQLRQKIIGLKNTYAKQRQSLQNTTSNILNQYLSFNKTLQSLNNLIRTHKFDYEKRNIFFHLPQNKSQDLRNYLMSTNEETKVEKIIELLGVSQIKEIKQTQTKLYDIFRKQLSGAQTTRQAIQQENMRIQDKNQQKELKIQADQRAVYELKINLEKKTIQSNELSRKDKSLVAQIQRLMKSIDEKIQQRNNLTESITTKNAKIQQNIRFKSHYQQKIEQTLDFMRNCQVQMEVKMVEFYEEMLNQGVDLNQDINISCYERGQLMGDEIEQGQWQGQEQGQGMVEGQLQDQGQGEEKNMKMMEIQMEQSRGEYNTNFYSQNQIVRQNSMNSYEKPPNKLLLDWLRQNSSSPSLHNQEFTPEKNNHYY